MEQAVELLREKGIAKARQARRPRGHRGHGPVLHPRQRQGRRARRGRLQHRLRRRATTTSWRSPATSRCTSPPPATRWVTEDEVPEDAKRAPSSASTTSRPADKPENVRPEDRRGQAAQVARGGRPAQAAARQHRQARGQDDRGAARRALGQDRRERRHPPLRPLRGRRVVRRPTWLAPRRSPPSSGSCSSCRARRSWATSSTAPTPTGSAPSPRRSRTCSARGVEVAIVVGARQHLPRAGGRGERHGPRHRRLHGHARDGAQRAAAAGRAGEAGRAHAGAVGDHDLRGRRALHPPPRDAPPREGPRRRSSPPARATRSSPPTRRPRCAPSRSTPRRS